MTIVNGLPPTGRTLSYWQVSLSKKLARRYGHLWATIPREDDPEIPSEVGAEWLFKLEATAQASNHPDLPAGIERPWCAMVDGRLAIVHETGSGRLTWTIFDDSIILEIRRPDGPVLRATVVPQATNHGPDWSYRFVGEIDDLSDSEDPNRSLHRRHVSAMIEALSALVTPQELFFKLHDSGVMNNAQLD